MGKERGTDLMDKREKESRNKKVFENYVRLKNYALVGRIHSISRERVRQIIARRLRKAFIIKNPDKF